MDNVVKLYQNSFSIPQEKAETMYIDGKADTKLLTVSQISQQIEDLMNAGISKEMMLEYPFVITMNPSKYLIPLSLFPNTFYLLFRRT